MAIGAAGRAIRPPATPAAVVVGDADLRSRRKVRDGPGDAARRARGPALPAVRARERDGRVEVHPPVGDRDPGVVEAERVVGRGGQGLADTRGIAPVEDARVREVQDAGTRGVGHDRPVAGPLVAVGVGIGAGPDRVLAGVVQPHVVAQLVAEAVVAGGTGAVDDGERVRGEARVVARHQPGHSAGAAGPSRSPRR